MLEMTELFIPVKIGLKYYGGAYLIYRFLLHAVLLLHAAVNHGAMCKYRCKALILKAYRHFRESLG